MKKLVLESDFKIVANVSLPVWSLKQATRFEFFFNRIGQYYVKSVPFVIYNSTIKHDTHEYYTLRVMSNGFDPGQIPLQTSMRLPQPRGRHC